MVLKKTVKLKDLFPHNHLFVSQPFNIVCFPTLRKVLKGIVMYHYMHFSTAESIQMSCHVSREDDRQPGSGMWTLQWGLHCNTQYSSSLVCWLELLGTIFQHHLEDPQAAHPLCTAS